MSELIDVYNKLKQMYPKALEVLKANVQGGIYISFDGLKQDAHKKDLASFSIKVSARTLAQDKTSVLPLLDELRVKTIQEQNRVFGVEIFKNIEFVSIEDGLYIYSLNLEIPIFRELVDEYLGDEDECIKDV